MIATRIVLLTLCALTAIAAFVDVRTRQIPNRLVLILFGFGVALQLIAEPLFSGAPEQSTWQRMGANAANVFVGIVVCGLVPCLLFRLRLIGGGDVKLLATVGATSGPLLGLQVEFYAFVLITLYATLRLVYFGQLLSVLGNSAALMANPLLPRARRRTAPAALSMTHAFAPAIFVASLLVALLRW